jgi:hypothetical protein
MANERAFKTVALTEVNEHILDAARDSVSEDTRWEFFCECGHPGCHEHVMLELDRYTALHDQGRAVLAPGHQLSQKERARRLREESEALRAQAAHQIKRARRNVGGA